MSKVEIGNKVSVHYRGLLNDGTEFDNSRDRDQPISFNVGSGEMINGFDSALPGMEVGETKSFTVSPENAYGEVNEDAVQNIPRQAFPPDFEFIEGATVQGTAPNGQPFLAKIVSQAEDFIVLDFNHPLAGQDLNFEIELIDIS